MSVDNGPCVVSCRSTFVCAVVMQLSVLCKQLDLLNAESEQTKAEQDHKAVVGSSQLSVFAVVSVGESVWVFRWRASHVWVSGGEHRTIIEYAKKKEFNTSLSQGGFSAEFFYLFYIFFMIRYALACTLFFVGK